MSKAPSSAATARPGGKQQTGVVTPPSSAPQGQDIEWSRRQLGCAGLQKRFYPEFQRDLVDFDYLKRLSESERVWLAAFTEEHYRGWRLKSEEQVHSLEQLRAADAARKVLQRGYQGLEKQVERESMDEQFAFGVTRTDGSRGREQLESQAAMSEDELVGMLDRKRAQERGSSDGDGERGANDDGPPGVRERAGGRGRRRSVRGP